MIRGGVRCWWGWDLLGIVLHPKMGFLFHFYLICNNQLVSKIEVLRVG